MRWSSVKSVLATPQAQDLRPALLHHLLRRRHVTERLRLLAALLVERKAVGEHPVVGRAPACAAGFEQRGLEPAAVLIGAFEVERRGPGELGPLAFEHEGMGGARVEPHVENVEHLSVVQRLVVVAQKADGLGGEPGVRAFFLHRIGDTRVHHFIAQNLARFLVHEQCERHAPGALARDHPVRARRHHRTDAVASLGRREFDARDLGQRHLAQGLAVKVRQRLVMAMNHCGVLRKMSGALERHECGYWWRSLPLASSAPASINSLMTAPLASPSLPSGVSTALAGEERHVRIVGAVFRDGERHLDLVLLTELVVVPGHGPARYARSPCRSRR